MRVAKNGLEDVNIKRHIEVAELWRNSRWVLPPESYRTHKNDARWPEHPFFILTEEGNLSSMIKGIALLEELEGG